MKIKFKRLDKDAQLPTRATEGAAGFDIYCNGFYTIAPSVRCLLDTGIAMAIPEGWCGFVMPRSGLAAKHGIDRLAGLIDSDYRGEVKVSLINHGESPVEFKKGDRIAQIIFVPVMLASCEVEEFEDTERGAGGFGSTGK
jgi:dUTP pyrophosphatase